VHEYDRLMTAERISPPGDGPATRRPPAARALPTQFDDPDLALLLGVWDRLAVEFKARLIDIIRENLPT